MIGDRFEHGWWKLPLLPDFPARLRVISLNDFVHYFSRGLLISAVLGHQILDNGEQNDLAKVHHQSAEEGEIVIPLDGQSNDSRQEGAARSMLPELFLGIQKQAAP